MSWGWQAPNRTPQPTGQPGPGTASIVRAEPDVNLLRRFAAAIGVQELVHIAARDDAMRRLEMALRLMA